MYRFILKKRNDFDYIIISFRYCVFFFNSQIFNSAMTALSRRPSLFDGRPSVRLIMNAIDICVGCI